MKETIKSKIVMAPLPVLIIGTYDAAGIPDAMNAAWGTQIGYEELTLLLDSGHKTTANIREKGQFTVAIGGGASVRLRNGAQRVQYRALPETRACH